MEHRGITTVQVAQIMGIHRDSVRKILKRYGVHPLGRKAGGGSSYLWDERLVLAATSQYKLDRVDGSRKVAININPEWRKPFFKTKTRRPTLTKEEHDLAVRRSRMSMLRDKIESQKTPSTKS